MNRLENLKPIFNNEDNIVFFCDNNDIAQWLAKQDLNTSLEINETNTNVVNIQTSIESFNQVSDIAKRYNSRILTIPQIVFDPSIEAVKYSSEKLLDAPFSQSYALCSEILNKLNASSDEISIQNNGANLSCRFSKHVSFCYPKILSLQPGQVRAAAEYLELHFEHTLRSNKLDFNVNGEMEVIAILFAFIPTSVDISTKGKKMFDLLSQVAGSTLSTIKVKDNKVQSFMIDGVEYIEMLKILAGSYRHIEVTEFAFGLNPNIRRHANWYMNSQINEGARGLHLGIGDGRSGYHIDFISPDIDVTTLLL